MPRPSKPLILREAVVEASLRIIDIEGLEALSLPRLARELNVQPPSLYHHFEDKADILRAVARALVLETRMPDPKSVPNWIEWFVALSLAFRQAMVQHRNAVPLMFQYMPRDVQTHSYSNGAAFLSEMGMSAEQVVLILDGLDKLTLGAAMTEATRGADESARPFVDADPSMDADLARAAAANQRSNRAVFAESIRCFLRGAAADVPPDAPPPQSWRGLGTNVVGSQATIAS